MPDPQTHTEARPRHPASHATPRHSLARVGAPALALAGVLFAAYPALRPYHDEAALVGAAGMASGTWVAAHTFGMIGFVLLSLGLMSLALHSGGRRSTVTAAVLGWLGTALVLPYYGAETFALQAIGARAVADQDTSLLLLADAFRYGPVPMIFFGAGLLCLAAAGVCIAASTWRAGGVTRLAGLTLGLGLVLYLPQFFGTPPMRIAHGVLLLLGCLLIAVRLSNPRPLPTAVVATQATTAATQ
ncbi:MAG: hypothetical protein ACTH2Q_06825 [Propionibacteriaceae bacterium]